MAVSDEAMAGSRERVVVQPGPVDKVRVESFAGPMRHLEFPLETGVSLLEAIARPLEATGIRSAGVRLAGVTLAPARYVMPARSDSAEHVAYYSATHDAAAPLAIEHANITVGQREGQRFIHCHAIWRDDTGGMRGGHILPQETMVAAPGRAIAFGSKNVSMVSRFDPETNFTLFRPETDSATEGHGDLEGIVARIRPNEDLVGTIEAVCARHGVETGVIRSGVGSLAGVEFEDGRRISEIPTEILVIDGRISGGTDGKPKADVTIGLIDTEGAVHVGRPARRRNPVLICFEVFIETTERGETEA